jgi:hypothetical protein
MQCPSLSAINTALRAVMVSTVQAYSADVTIVPETQEADPDAAKILILQSFRPEIVTGAELGGRYGNARRSGNYLVTLSSPKGDRIKMQKAWEVSDKLAEAFRALELVCAGGGVVYTNEPYITNAGTAPDERNSLLVTVPWVAWTGGEEE